MLVLTRAVGEAVMIGDDIQIIFLGTNMGELKIGIVAPREIPIYRLEIFNRIQKEKAHGSGSDEPTTKG
jgi:carbon storage regulator